MPKRSNVLQITVTACFLLALLRIAIGWQFLYEGLWKLKTQKTSQPWSAEGYLANAQGPFRDNFRKLAGDPDGLKKLDYGTVTAEWDRSVDRFINHFKTTPPQADRLTESQAASIKQLVDGPSAFAQPLSALPEGVDLKKFRFRRPTPGPKAYVKYESANKRLITNAHLLPEELAEFVKLAPKEDPKLAEYTKAAKSLIDRSGKLSLKERLRVLLVEDRDRNGHVQKKYEGSADGKRPGDLDVYKHLLDRYNRDLAVARVHYQHEHLARQWSDIQERKGKLTGPVNALTAELETELYKTLTPKQYQYGLPEKPQPFVNQSVIWGLIVLGALMMAGLFSRTASFGAAVMLLMFYLAMPPFPGVPEAPGLDHSLIVNKNLIECLACLALASLPTGRWLGIDALIRRFVWRKTTD